MAELKIIDMSLQIYEFERSKRKLLIAKMKLWCFSLDVDEEEKFWMFVRILNSVKINQTWHIYESLSSLSGAFDVWSHHSDVDIRFPQQFWLRKQRVKNFSFCKWPELPINFQLTSENCWKSLIGI